MSGISTHVLDVSAGAPACGIPVRLERKADGVWVFVGNAITDADGRVTAWSPVEAAEYRLTFETRAYFGTQGVDALYPEVVVIFAVRDAAKHHHIPLLLAPNGYTTYRGS